ncbi:MAG: LPS export ABC transporter periplasmic protein LptC [Ghiorsea sp.]
MFTYLKWFFLALGVCSVAYTGFLMLTAKHNIQQIVDVAALKAGTKVIKPDMTEYDGDTLVWRLQADAAQDKEEVLLLDQPRLEMVLDNGEHVPIRSFQGVYHKEQQKIHLKGDVVVRYQAWDLSSASMDYFQTQGELVAAEDFVLKQDGIRITGKDLRVLKEGGRLKVLQGVHMDIEESK